MKFYIVNIKKQSFYQYGSIDLLNKKMNYLFLFYLIYLICFFIYLINQFLIFKEPILIVYITLYSKQYFP